MNGVHVYTSFTFSYLSRALVLARTLRRHHPDWRFWAVITDVPPPGLEPESWIGEFDEALDAAELFPQDWRNWIFKHDIVEACTAVKGEALRHLFASGAEKVIYLDPDIAVFHDLTPIAERLDASSIVLTPHQVAPNATASEFADNELTAMRFGVFNLGFLAVRNDQTGRALADWWAAQLRRACYDDPESGIFTDQKYFDLVPALFPSVHIERDPGCNVASWNLSKREVRISPNGEIRVNDALLRFYHFTKINSVGDVMTERYATENMAALEIWHWYKRAIAAAAVPGVPDGYWALGVFANGSEIPKEARILFRERPELSAAFADPFEVGPGTFHAWLLENGVGAWADRLRARSAELCAAA